MIARCAAVLAGVLVALAIGTPAQAHTADAPTASDYRTAVTGITPPLPGLTVRVVEAGARLELVNHTRRTIEVLGYAGEPYLQVRPDGVDQNANSPTAYINETLTGGVAPPPGAGPAVAPAWQRLSGTPAVLWHDQRTHWIAARPPSNVLADPGTAHHIRDWSVPLRDGVRTFTVTGTLDWVPPPSPAIWWAGCLLLGTALAGLGLLRSPAAARWPALVAIGCGLAAAGYALGTALDSGALTAAGVARAVLAQQTWPVVCALAAVAAGTYAALHRPAADLALAIAGTCLALFSGIANAAVFAHGVVPQPWPAGLARVLVLLAVSGGLGVAAASVLRLRSLSPPPSPTTTPVGVLLNGPVEDG
ncbi:MAG: hypothetical protein V7603_2188 [Micromonosporaceae bacterium]